MHFNPYTCRSVKQTHAPARPGTAAYVGAPRADAGGVPAACAGYGGGRSAGPDPRADGSGVPPPGAKLFVMGPTSPCGPACGGDAKPTGVCRGVAPSASGAGGGAPRGVAWGAIGGSPGVDARVPPALSRPRKEPMRPASCDNMPPTDAPRGVTMPGLFAFVAPEAVGAALGVPLPRGRGVVTRRTRVCTSAPTGVGRATAV